MNTMSNYRPFNGWHKFADETGKSSYTDYAKPGDVVDGETYDYFLNCLPPAAFGKGYIQMGEAYNHIALDDGRVVSTFLTIARGLDGKLHFNGDLPYRHYRKEDGDGAIAIWPFDVI